MVGEVVRTVMLLGLGVASWLLIARLLAAGLFGEYTQFDLD